VVYIPHIGTYISLVINSLYCCKHFRYIPVIFEAKIIYLERGKTHECVLKCVFYAGSHHWCKHPMYTK